MTAQIKDVVRVRKNDYFIVGCSPCLFPFDPRNEGIEVLSDSTANRRGFHARYVVDGQQLTLLSVSVSLIMAEYDRVLAGEGTRLFGKDPVPSVEQSTGFLGTAIAVARAIHPYIAKRVPEGIGSRWALARNYVEYNNLCRHIGMTGGLLIGRNRDSRWGSDWAWYYDELWELEFDAGYLKSATDRSATMASIRAWVREQHGGESDTAGEIGNRNRGLDRGAVITRLRNDFGRDYNFGYRY